MSIIHEICVHNLIPLISLEKTHQYYYVRNFYLENDHLTFRGREYVHGYLLEKKICSQTKIFYMKNRLILFKIYF
jgi:hypothetical protein